MRKILTLSLLAIMTICALSSCQGLFKSAEEKEALANTISIHLMEEKGRSGNLVKTIKVDNHELRLVRLPLISNRDLMHAESRPYDDKYTLVLIDPTKIGRSRWQHASSSHAGRRIVILQGGEFKCFAKFEPHYNRRGNLKLYCEANEETTDKICSQIKKSYRALIGD